jgi:lipopolysaccharide/colanic/teichoic acid biosynthesis glycosyltransferase
VKKETYSQVKRRLDLIFGVILLLVLFPVLLLIGVLILLIDRRPVLFMQLRTGQFNKAFTIYKFRTLKSGSNDDQIHHYDWDGKVPDNFMFRTPAGLEKTKLGRLLRKTSLDELPQLLNVIKGEMSFVGPRPEIPEITIFYDKNQKRRLLVKPGITGLAQVSGRSEIPYGLKVKYDLKYVERMSFLLDLKIVCKTLVQVLIRKGVNH